MIKLGYIYKVYIWYLIFSIFFIKIYEKFITNIDSIDWKNKGIEHEINQVLNNKKLEKGSIILFHNDAKYTPEALEIILKGLKDKGYEIVPVSELIYKENYFINYEGKQIIHN